MECHQGRASKVQVDEAIAKVGVADDDTVSADLGFTNIHYRAAAATLYGTETKGGYEYEGQAYDAKHDHVEGFSTCIGCHDSIHWKSDSNPARRHSDVATSKVCDVREPSSAVDYDEDGNVPKACSMKSGLQEWLAIQAYGSMSLTAIAYSGCYPYFSQTRMQWHC
jgi:hypothetical protein